jgi:hypothetical protein
MKMKRIGLAIIMTALGLASTAYTAEDGGKATVTFMVGCFDAGASALQGKPGVISVQKGWQGGREVNRVTFDPKQISVKGMEARLKRAGTHIATLPEMSPDREKGK